MPRPKANKEELKERKIRAVQFRDFMKQYLFTEVRMAESLGVSRRSVQMIKAGKVTPHKDTLRLFQTLVAKYKQENKKKKKINWKAA